MYFTIIILFFLFANNKKDNLTTNDLLKKELNTSPFLNKDIDKAIEYQAQLKSNILQQYQLQEKLNKEKENYNKKKGFASLRQNPQSQNIWKKVPAVCQNTWLLSFHLHH